MMPLNSDGLIKNNIFVFVEFPIKTVRFELKYMHGVQAFPQTWFRRTRIYILLAKKIALVKYHDIQPYMFSYIRAQDLGHLTSSLIIMQLVGEAQFGSYMCSSLVWFRQGRSFMTLIVT